MFNNSVNTTISRGIFSTVQGNQYINYLEPDVPTRFSPGDEWKMELYKEYDRVPTGRVKLLKMLYEFRVWRWEFQSEEGGSLCEIVRAKRVFNIARLGNGKEESPCLSIRYTGHDARKVFKEDCIKFSRIKHASFVQLRAFNDSDNPMIFFHDEELIPVGHLIQNHRDCRLPLLSYLSFQTALITNDYFLPFDICHTNVWIHPQNGMIVIGPEGPEPEAWFGTSPFDLSLTSFKQHALPVLPMNLYNSRNILNCLAKSVPEPFELPIFSNFTTGPFHPFCSYHTLSPVQARITVPSVYSPSQNLIARFQGVDYTQWKMCPLGSSILMDDGRIRFQIHDASDECFFMFYPSHSFILKLRSSWLAQFCYVFERLNVPHNKWKDCNLLIQLCLALKPDINCSHSSLILSPTVLNPPHYLFVWPPPVLSNGFPDISQWLLGRNLYYWSSDPNGNSVVTEEECVMLGLPCYVPESGGRKDTWSVQEYDFFREFQEAKGFDPHTTDYAWSLGLPILEVVSSEEGCFEAVSDDIDSSFSVSKSQDKAEPMEVDCPGSDFHFSESIPLRMEEMDVEMEDHCSHIGCPTVEVGMEADN